MSDTNEPEEIDTQAAEEAPPEPPARSDATVTTLNRKWVIKMAVIVLVLVAFGGWALYDAKIAYPDRGANASEYFEYQYLDVIAKTRPPLTNDAGIPNPAERMAQIREMQRQTGQIDPIDTTRLRWLESLELIEQVTPEATALPRKDFRGVDVNSAIDRHAALTKRWTTTQGGAINAPKPLSAFDIPSQWAILAICWAIALWIIVTLVKAKTKTYRWDPTTLALTLPDGSVILPSDIAELDKRKWHKFYVAMHVKPEHATAGGRVIEMDLLRHEPLEQWILDMEKVAFPEPAVTPATPEPVA